MIRYREGYKYQLASAYRVMIEIYPLPRIATSFIALEPDGLLTISEGYAWDGPSGPAIDTSDLMQASLVHDALYQLMREGHLAYEHREAADRILQRIYSEDAEIVAARQTGWGAPLRPLLRGVAALRQRWIYAGVRFGGGPSAAPDNDNDNPILTAP